MNQLDQIKELIRQDLPDAHVTIEDLNGGGDHLQVKVVSEAFTGLSLISQHKLVYGALKKQLATEQIHALALNTSLPS